MEIKRKQINNNQSSKIKDLISFNNSKNPFQDSRESEQFFKSLIEEEMNLSNNYNSENLNRLLELYFKGINYYQNTPNIDKVNAFIEKSQVLLQTSKAKKILNQTKTKNVEISENKTDSTLIDENEESDNSNKNKKISKIKEIQDDGEDEGDINDNLPVNNFKIEIRRNKTMRINEIQNRNKLNYLSNTIKKSIKEKNKQKLEIKRINNEFNNIREKQLKTSIFLEDEIKKQSDNFKVKLSRKRTMKMKNYHPKLKINTIKEENIHEEEEKKTIKKKISNKKIEIRRYNTPNNKKKKSNYIKSIDKNKIMKKKSFSLSVNINKIFNQINDCINNKQNNQIKKNKDNEVNNKTNKLKDKISIYINEYNNDIYKYYFLPKMNNILDLGIKNFTKNQKIYEGYNINIKDLEKQQIECNNEQEERILEDEINGLKEEQDHEIEKNNDLYEKIIDDEISKFKILGYPKSSIKELETLKNKIKCDLYNEIYNILNK